MIVENNYPESVLVTAYIESQGITGFGPLCLMKSGESKLILGPRFMVLADGKELHLAVPGEFKLVKRGVSDVDKGILVVLHDTPRSWSWKTGDDVFGLRVKRQNCTESH